MSKTDQTWKPLGSCDFTTSKPGLSGLSSLVAWGPVDIQSLMVWLMFLPLYFWHFHADSREWKWNSYTKIIQDQWFNYGLCDWPVNRKYLRLSQKSSLGRCGRRFCSARGARSPLNLMARWHYSLEPSFGKDDWVFTWTCSCIVYIDPHHVCHGKTGKHTIHGGHR